MKITSKMFRKYIFLLPLILSLSFAQEIRTINFKTGSLQTYVDIYRGNFSIYDTDQSDLDFVSLLFGGATTPSSFFKIFVDRKSQTLDQMQAVYPLGVSLSSQIDGTYMAGEDKDIQVDIAFFALDLLNSGDLNSVGIVINLSNTSDISRRVGAKILLDTDVGEIRNDPLVYLPSGDRITNAFIFGGENNIPPFLFIGQKNVAETRPIGKGFYIYPYLSETMPSSMIVANWKNLAEQEWNVDRINPSFTYSKNTTTKDVGVSMCFGDITLAPNQSGYFGIVISKLFSNVWPVLQEDSISKGVLNKDRFEVEELLKYAENTATSHKPSNFNPLIMDNPYTIFQRKREQYRLQQLYSNHAPKTFDILENITNLSDDDNFWQVIHQLDWNSKQKAIDVDKVLSNRNYTGTDTNHTIFKDRLFQQ